MAHTASSTIRQIGLPVSRESRLSSAFVSGRIDATSFGYSLVFRGRPFASASAGGRPRPRLRFSVAISCPAPPYYRMTFLAIYNSFVRHIVRPHFDQDHTVKLLAPPPYRLVAEAARSGGPSKINTCWSKVAGHPPRRLGFLAPGSRDRSAADLVDLPSRLWRISSAPQSV